MPISPPERAVETLSSLFQAALTRQRTPQRPQLSCWGSTQRTLHSDNPAGQTQSLFEQLTPCTPARGAQTAVSRSSCILAPRSSRNSRGAALDYDRSAYEINEEAISAWLASGTTAHRGNGDSDQCPNCVTRQCSICPMPSGVAD
jgi:hypothetical protein